MKFITISGPPSSGKTSVILKTIENLKEENLKIGVIKFDCLSSYDNLIYEKYNIPVKVGLSGNLCPDHFYITNIEDGIEWGKACKLDILLSESAGLCNRCSPHIKNVLAICVIDNLSGVNTPRKIGPMLKFADVVVVTKGDIVSQAEREVFTYKIKQANPMAKIIHINGITGQGSYYLSRYFKQSEDVDTLIDNHLRFSMPSALCSYCIGQTKIGKQYEMGSVRRMNFKVEG